MSALILSPLHLPDLQLNFQISGHHFFPNYNLEAVFCKQFIPVIIAIRLINFIFLHTISSINFK